MSIPDAQSLRLPVLRVFADNGEHSIQEIRERMRIEFNVSTEELSQKHPTGNSVFHVNIALALANLQGAPHRGSKAITKIKRDVYRITPYGNDILKRNPSELSLSDL